MRLKSFQIQNYRSILDSGIVELSSRENICVLAGQNESGKSSILMALRDFEKGKFDVDSVPFTLEGTPEQTVSCTYMVQTRDTIADRLNAALVKAHKIAVKEGVSILNKSKISRIKEFTITRKGAGAEGSISIDNTTFNIVRAAILEKPKTVEEGHAGDEAGTKYLELGDDDNNTIADHFWRLAPPIVFFDDFCDLLPDSILVEDLKEEKTEAKGFHAAENFQSILKIDFVERETESDAVRRTKESRDNKTLSVDFQKDWGQRIHGQNKVNVKYDFQKRAGGKGSGSYINFYVETKEGQLLPPKKRSKGLIWFLSLWLELKAQDLENDELILLLDEPDQHLHVKAQDNILGLISKLAKQGKQVVYATHSPYLLQVEHINRIRLIINDKDQGTIIENITTSKIDSENKKDALQPVADAIGLHVSEFSPIGRRNIFLEGVSDFYYFSGMKRILQRKGDYGFVPGIGVRKINALISLAIGWGLDWLAIIDDDKKDSGNDSRKKFEELSEYIFDGDAAKAGEKIYIMKDIAGVENMFTLEDLKLVDSHITRRTNKSEAVGKNRKIVFARLFYEKVQNGEIESRDISKSARENFSKAFKYIEERI